MFVLLMALCTSSDSNTNSGLDTEESSPARPLDRGDFVDLSETSPTTLTLDEGEVLV